MRKLTAKQEAFAQAIADGCTQTAAYFKAYQCPQMSLSSAGTEAYRVANRPHVAARIDELRAHHARTRFLTRERKRELLAAVLESTSEKTIDKLRAIEIDNRMTGEDAPMQVQVFGLEELLEKVRGGQ